MNVQSQTRAKLAASMKGTRHGGKHADNLFNFDMAKRKNRTYIAGMLSRCRRCCGVAVPPTGGRGIGHGTAVVYRKSHTVVWAAASVRELVAAWLLLPVLFFSGSQFYEFVWLANWGLSAMQACRLQRQDGGVLAW